MAADAWELRTARLEGAYEQVDRRLGAIEGRLSTLEHKMDTGFAQIRAEMTGLRNELHNELHSEIAGLRAELLGRMDRQLARADRQFYWLLGTLGALVVSGLLPLGLKLTGH